MKRMKQCISFVTAVLLGVSSLPISGSTVNAATVDAVVRLTPSEASTFNDTNGDGLGEFEGWGTSLCWWANRLGYSETLTQQAAEYFFSDDGLDMNIGRYNVGGGDMTGSVQQVPENENADFYSISDATYTGTSMKESTLTALSSSSFTVSDADFGFTKGNSVGELTYIGWINELGTADDTTASGGNLHFNVTAQKSGSHTVKILLTLSGSNERGVAIRVNNTTDYIVEADTVNANVIASSSNQKLFLVTISDVALNEGENTIDLGGCNGDWTLDFVKMAVIDSEELGVLPEENEFLHSEHIIRSDSGVPGYTTDVTKMDLNNNTLDYYKANYEAVDEESGYAWNYDWSADSNQLNILKAALSASGDDFHAEAFSNSPPYFMTESGCSSGNTSSSVDNLRSDCYNAFATYMADVIEHLIKVEGVEIKSATGMNEPYTDYWGAYSNKQEGCHFDQGESQSKIIVALNNALQERGIDIVISGTDETSIDTQITSYNALSDEAKEIVERIDTHTYSGSNRAGLNALAESESKNLWMSEVDGAYTGGTNAGEMSAALGLAQRIMTDVNGLESSAWILWNAIDMHVDSSEYGQSWVNKGSANDFLTEEAMYKAWMSTDESGYWGLAAANHDTEEILLTMKYYAYGQFSRYIRPGYTIIGTSSTGNTLAAYDSENNKVVIVSMNTSASDQTWKFDLSLFNEVSSDAKVTAIRTSGDMESGEKWADVSSSVNAVVNDTTKSVEADMKANSITTFIIEGVTYDPNNAVVDNTVEVEITEDMISGSTPWNGNTSNDVDKLIDDDFSTFFDGVGSGYVIINLGKVTDIASIAYAPRSGYEGRCVDACIYGSNDGENWDLIYTITSTPSSGKLSYVYAAEFASGTSEYQYVKYAVDENGNCNISELKVFTSIPEIKSVENVSVSVCDGQEVVLPTTVTGTTEDNDTYELSVTWNVGSVDFDELDLFEIVEISGFLEGSSLTATATVVKVPENLEYLIDCHNPNSDVWNAVSKSVDTLVNTDSPDQAKTEENSWGRTFAIKGEDGAEAEWWDYDKSGNTLYEYGYWAYSGKTISYDITLDAGVYTVMVGGFDFWNGRTENVYYSVNGGEKQLVCELTISNDVRTDASGMITVQEDNSVVSISVEKGSNGGDPILGFIAVNEEKIGAVLESAAAKLDIPNKDDVRGNITLPETADGVEVTWTTDHPEIVDVTSHEVDGYDDMPAGVVTRPAEDTVVTMIATLTYKGETKTKEFQLNVKAAPSEIDDSDYTDYFFAYFAGEGYSDGEQIYFASSQDGLNWDDLNANDPILTSTLGENGVRDPYIIRSAEGDKFYLIATDLKIYGSNDWTKAQEDGSQCIMVWESTDLVNWSEQRMVEISADIDAGCTWAPECYYDDLTGEYVVYWASKTSADDYAKQRVYYAKTRDFYSFTEPEVFIEYDESSIDTTIIYDETTQMYYRFTKNEGSNTNELGALTKTIFVEKSSTLLGDWTLISSESLNENQWVEGPTIFKFNQDDADTDTWCLLVDDFGGIGYYPLISTDLSSGVFTNPEESYVMPTRARHGTPIRITAAEYEAVMNAYGSAETVEMVTTIGQTPELPETVTMQGTGVEKAVTWNLEDVSFDVDPYKYVTVTGTVEGSSVPVTAEIQVIPENVEYMIDCNNTESDTWKNVVANSKYMLNVDAADQEKTDENTWGYVSVVGEDMKGYSQNDVSNPYAGGYWATSDADIIYQVTLPAGEHTIMLGCTGWWSMSREMDVYYTVNDGEEQKLCDFDAVKSSETYAQGVITLEEQSVVTLSVRKAASDDGILSWISISGIPAETEELDYSALETLIQSAEALNAEDYTEESFETVTSALNNAKALLNNAETQDEITQATEALRKAIADLEEAVVVVPVDKSELQDLYDANKDLKQDDYTEESYQALKDALEAAKAVLEDETVEQEDVSKAYLDLYDAVKGLEKVPVEEPDEPTNPDVPENPDDSEKPKDDTDSKDDANSKDDTDSKDDSNKKDNTDKSDKTDKKNESVKTGDSSIVFVYAGIVILMMAIFVCTAKRRKNQ